MSSPPPADVLPPPPPPGLNYIATIQPSITFLMIITVFATLTVPILICLFVFSTPQTRRRVIFQVNVLLILLGLALGFLNGYITIHAILSPLDPTKEGTYLTYVFLGFILPILTDSILLLRLLAVFPPKTTRRRTLLLILAFPVIMKIGRITDNILFLIEYKRTTDSSGGNLAAGQTLWGKQPYTKIDWFFQLADNSYMSAIFLYKIRSRQLFQSSGSVYTGRGIAHRLRVLFLIALFNFVFPVVFNLIQLIFVFRDPSFMHGSYIYWVNNYVGIIGVVFATVWSSGANWAEGKEIIQPPSLPWGVATRTHPTLPSTGFSSHIPTSMNFSTGVTSTVEDDAGIKFADHPKERTRGAVSIPMTVYIDGDKRTDRLSVRTSTDDVTIPRHDIYVSPESEASGDLKV